jgi:hypothetical protein
MGDKRLFVIILLLKLVLVICDFHIKSIATAPGKTDSPLVIDPNTVLPFPVMFELFQAVAGRHTKIIQLNRSVEDQQLPGSPPPNFIRQPSWGLMSEETISVLIGE